MLNELHFCEMWLRPDMHGAGLALRALCRRAVHPGSTMNTVVCRLLLQHVNHDVRHQIWLTVARGGLCVVEEDAMCVEAVFTAMTRRSWWATVGMPSPGAPMTDDDIDASRGFRLLVAPVIRTINAKKRSLHEEYPTEFIKRVIRENPPMIPELVLRRTFELRSPRPHPRWRYPPSMPASSDAEATGGAAAKVRRTPGRMSNFVRKQERMGIFVPRYGLGLERWETFGPLGPGI